MKIFFASITRIMTCNVTIDNANLEEEFIFTSDVIRQEGSSFYLELGDITFVFYDTA